MNNPPFFPSPPIFTTTDERSEQRDGITLRDYFAVKAMQAFMNNPLAWDFKNSKESKTIPVEIARCAYEMADLMLFERERKP